ncbi:hypothetical protein HanIR_Chr05g0249091 [Helianthus annuus]|nr:hypothetical protein HanIR_Chr05g0249091 [Helianthus annuus]
MGVRMGQRGWRYGNGGMDLKCICIYCIYRCVREGEACFLSSCGASPTSRRGRPGRSREGGGGGAGCLTRRWTRTNRGRSPYRTALRPSVFSQPNPLTHTKSTFLTCYPTLKPPIISPV